MSAARSSAHGADRAITRSITRHRHAIAIRSPLVEVVDLFDHRPRTWLSPFLRLATNPLRAESPVAAHPAATGRRPWFRLGDPQPEPDGVVAPLTWRPAVSGVFTRFDGTLAARPGGDRTELVIEGRATGGRHEVNDAVVRRVIYLLGSALDGPRAG